MSAQPQQICAKDIVCFLAKKAVCLEDHRQALQKTRWSSRELSRRLPALLRIKIEPQRRALWMNGLRQSWRRGFWAMGVSSCRQLFELTVVWRDWALACEVGQSIKKSLDGHGALLLMDALRQMGLTQAALDMSVRRQLAEPCDERHANAHRLLLEDIRFCENWPVIEGALWEEPELRLVPLMSHHLDDFAWQYGAADIVELCRLPDFQNQQNWHEWLDSIYLQKDELPLAVVHRELGFIGCSHLVMHDGVGFLYYWLGEDFRGQGLAFRANRLLLEAAYTNFGLRACYAKVYECNTPSRRLLERLGFECLQIHALPPDENEVFYHLGEPITPGRVREELIEFLVQMKSSTVVAGLVEGIKQ